MDKKILWIAIAVVVVLAIAVRYRALQKPMALIRGITSGQKQIMDAVRAQAVQKAAQAANPLTVVNPFKKQ